VQVMDLEDIEDESIREKIMKNLERHNLDWDKLPEKKQEQIVEGSKEVDKKVRRGLGQRLT